MFSPYLNQLGYKIQGERLRAGLNPTVLRGGSNDDKKPDQKWDITKNVTETRLSSKIIFMADRRR